MPAYVQDVNTGTVYSGDASKLPNNFVGFAVQNSEGVWEPEGDLDDFGVPVILNPNRTVREVQVVTIADKKEATK